MLPVWLTSSNARKKWHPPPKVIPEERIRMCAGSPKTPDVGNIANWKGTLKHISNLICAIAFSVNYCEVFASVGVRILLCWFQDCVRARWFCSCMLYVSTENFLGKSTLSINNLFVYFIIFIWSIYLLYTVIKYMCENLRFFFATFCKFNLIWHFF